MRTRCTLKIHGHLNSPAEKKRFNEQLFDQLAPTYDFMNRVLSFCLDQRWKRKLIADLHSMNDPACLDLACGSGDLCFLLARRYPSASITGIDISDNMLKRAQERNVFPSIQFEQRDMCSPELPAETFDLATGGYALRNAPDLETALSNIHRILKPGGVCGFLDFSKPAGRTVQRLELFFLKFWTGLWGLLLHRNPDVYGYIAESLRLYPDRRKLHGLLKKHGFKILSSRLYFFGVIELLMLRKTAV